VVVGKLQSAKRRTNDWEMTAEVTEQTPYEGERDGKEMRLGDEENITVTV
jgi:hypothetical protein